ncbi:hypothetical protein T11_2123 [Trichinella zimbabwensis]|uniref:Uncharacterized protein n=1 Tax=Trichinella zimbabwensis TaxID=268475 RepID=A0A0V1GVF3_9BILA|nr:hypothetical protein T11_2123 [Trichinella zimbabwensis]
MTAQNVQGLVQLAATFNSPRRSTRRDDQLAAAINSPQRSTRHDYCVFGIGALIHVIYGGGSRYMNHIPNLPELLLFKGKH